MNYSAKRALSLILAFSCLSWTSLYPQASSAPTNTEIIQELERMRARIQELEAELKARNDAPAKAVAPTTDAPATASVLEKPADAAPKNEEPFGFADWTWLTGNPR